MKLRKCILVNNECYQTNRKIKVGGIVVHSTGANNPYLSRYVQPDDGELGGNKYGNHWNQFRPDGRQVCVHAFIGLLKDGKSVATYQTLPWDHRGWHAGGTANDSYIGFEICEDDLSSKEYFDKVYKEAAELCAMLCKQYGIKPEKPYLICHSEAHALGIGSNHGDVMHWFPKYGKNMDIFRTYVKELMGNAPAEEPKIEPVNNGTYELKTDVGGYNTAVDAMNRTNKKTTVKKGTYHVFREYGGAINVTKTPGTPGSWINPSDNKAEEAKKVLYRVRASWDNVKSQVGAYENLDNAKREADKHPGYSVYDEQGDKVYPEKKVCPTCGQ